MDASLSASLIQSGLATGIIAALALPALRPPGRALLLPVAALAFLDVFATVWPAFRGTPLHFIGGSWNWNGKLVDLAVLAVVAALFVVTGLFTRQELGATFVQSPGTWRAVLFAMAPLLCLFVFAVWKLAPHEPLDAETIGYQLTMPGLTEELAYRGLLLALFDRMFVPARTILGAKMGYGALATSLAFAALRTISVNRALHVSSQCRRRCLSARDRFCAVLDSRAIRKPGAAGRVPQRSERHLQHRAGVRLTRD